MARNGSVTRRGFLAGAGLALGLAACASDAGEDATDETSTSAKGSEKDELADAEDAGAASGTDDAEDAGTDASEDADSDADDADAGDAASDAGTASTDGLVATWNLRSSWVSEGSYFAKYEIDLQNGTGADVDGWELVVTFNGAIGLSDSWNGSYSASGSTLTIGNASYNGAIQAGDTAYDIGFIVSGDEGLAIESVSAQAS